VRKFRKHTFQCIHTSQNHVESLNRVLERDKLARGAREHLGHLEGLGQEALDFAGSRHRHLVVFGQFVHAQNGDDVLERLVVLK